MAHIVIIPADSDGNPSPTTTRMTDRVYGPFPTWTGADDFHRTSGGTGFIYTLNPPDSFQKEEDL